MVPKKGRKQKTNDDESGFGNILLPPSYVAVVMHCKTYVFFEVIDALRKNTGEA
jgi:hypothetical protein